jgi:hypothetical protein
MPSGVIFLIALLPVSETNRLPDESRATPRGFLKPVAMTEKDPPEYFFTLLLPCSAK